MTKDLTSALGMGPREHVAIVGGGGKTSLMFALAEELRSSGFSVVTSTTTRIRHREVRDWPSVTDARSDPAFYEEVLHGLEIYGHLFVARRILGSGKVEGIGPALADLLYRDKSIDHLILEADGAAGRPVKAPADHEPVIPDSATMVVAMMGLEALGKPLGPELVFRPDRFEEICGLVHGERLTPSALSRIFQSPDGLFRGSPPTAMRIAFLNKLDLIPDIREAEHLANLVLKDSRNPVGRVVIGSIKKESYLFIKKESTPLT